MLYIEGIYVYFYSDTYTVLLVITQEHHVHRDKGKINFVCYVWPKYFLFVIFIYFFVYLEIMRLSNFTHSFQHTNITNWETHTYTNNQRCMFYYFRRICKHKSRLGIHKIHKGYRQNYETNIFKGGVRRMPALFRLRLNKQI